MKRLTVPAGMPDAAHSAWRVALRRAAHQLFDAPCVFADPFAVPLLGEAGQEALRRTPKAQGRAWSRSLRAFVVARSRFAEDALAAAYAQGVRQYCVLGAGLDTFALRNPWSDLRVVEVDQPAVQAWKRELAGAAGLAFDTVCAQIPGDLLDMAWPPPGLDASQPVFFSLLGVAPFLPRELLVDLFARLRQFPAGSGVVLDYRLPVVELGEEEQRQHASLQVRATAKGEPFSEGWGAREMAVALSGFTGVRDLGREALNALYFAGRVDGLGLRGMAARVVCGHLRCG